MNVVIDGETAKLRKNDRKIWWLGGGIILLSTMGTLDVFLVRIGLQGVSLYDCIIWWKAPPTATGHDR